MPSDLWDFARRLYARPGVEATCLQLQGAGSDVCLLLCGCWLEQAAQPYSESLCRALQDLAAPWQQQVILPLRELRQNWRSAAQQQPALNVLREQLKGLELQAEQQLLLQLQACVDSWQGHAHGAPTQWLGALAAPAGDRHPDALQGLRVEASQT